MSFEGEIALVTGAGKGFGRAIALALAKQGSAVALVARTASDVEAVAAEIEAAGGKALAIAADVTQEADVERSIRETRAQLGAVTQFVNNAGVGWPYGPVGGMDVARWWQAQHLHQLAPMLYLSRLLPAMRAAGKGRVVIVSAKASHVSAANMSAYITGKTAQVRIVNVAALEVKDAGVSLFAIDPGFVVTDLARETMTSPEAKIYLSGMVERLGEASSRDFSGDLAACGQRVVDLMSGRYDALTGRYFEMYDDLDEALKDIEA
ncbi:SDR family NAD(P)-dependent oxidoreductase [Sphingobium nicotianae]|uniref:SDR family oxidoreductase n=1 Tax=Sphingobium nicotianae TaxID=2782607 RepID=A0A9X1IPA5_9SPHN|nr:SDR family oxidoreductase [Sphingobium nicotianae]MBT2185982.1 SDR family oxidoreductase [Sphingobium nicotianae]